MLLYFPELVLGPRAMPSRGRTPLHLPALSLLPWGSLPSTPPATCSSERYGAAVALRAEAGEDRESTDGTSSLWTVGNATGKLPAMRQTDCGRLTFYIRFHTQL